MAVSNLHYDVAVIGGGMVGLGFAIELKKSRPQTSIIVLEKAASPPFKVGESLTSTATAYLRELGLTDQVMRRECRSKFGQSFWWTGQDSADVGYYIDSRVGETYHVERRPVEITLGRAAERLGVEIRRGVTARIASLGADGSVLDCESAGDRYAVRAAVVCDASGTAAVIPRVLGYHQPGPVAGFNTTAYYGYFRARPGSADSISSHIVNSTSHICFPQGWMWVIALTSWEQTPDARLGELADYLLDHRGSPDSEILSRADLAARLGCRYEEIVSIGVTVRDDDDTARALPAGERFTHYVSRYPGLAQVMEGFQLVTPYGVKYKQRRSIAYHSTQVAGDGWIAMGDAVTLVNPLFSPGMKDGLKMALAAAPIVAAALDGGRADRAHFSSYEETVGNLVSVAFRETEMLYRGFRYSSTYERTMSLRTLVGALIILKLGRLPIPPPVWDPIWRRYLDVLDRVISVERQAEAESWAEPRWAEELDAVIGPFVAWMSNREIVQRAHLGDILSYYTDDLEPRYGSDVFRYSPAGRKCPGCDLLAEVSLSCCPRCGVSMNAAIPAQAI